MDIEINIKIKHLPVEWLDEFIKVYEKVSETLIKECLKYWGMGLPMPTS